MLKGRFAPSPSGRMHLGNIYAALMSWLSVRKKNGAWLLRIEDLDRQRCKGEYAEQLLDDLRWLGLDWDEGGTAEYFQSERDAVYERLFFQLEAQGLVYDCFCSRTDLLASSAPHASDGRTVYSGHCRYLSAAERERLFRDRLPAKRIRVDERDAVFVDGHYGEIRCNLLHDCGDFILRRADGNFSYQLAVVADDALMGVTEVVRGRDLLSSTHQQLYLYEKLGFTPPDFFHLPLLLSADGHRLSKRDRDTDMGFLRMHYSPEQIVGHLLYICGLIDRKESVSLKEAIGLFDWNSLPCKDIMPDCSL